MGYFQKTFALLAGVEGVQYHANDLLHPLWEIHESQTKRLQKNSLARPSDGSNDVRSSMFDRSKAKIGCSSSIAIR